MTTKEVYARDYVLKPGSTPLTSEHKLAPPRALVLAHARLSSYSEHHYKPVATALAAMKQFIESGVVKNVADGVPLVSASRGPCTGK
jgi:hypothetical protein